jgi:hypothetical protein
MLPQWGRVVPFTLVTPWQFRLLGPPALTSADYARDYEEVKQLGRKDSKVRTAAQSEIARYWYEGSAQGWSRIARVVAGERTLDLWERARLLALVNASIADGFIAGFDTRYVFDLWRPITAIRLGADDGNEETAADGAWESYLNTPPIPEYPSSHSVDESDTLVAAPFEQGSSNQHRHTSTILTKIFLFEGLNGAGRNQFCSGTLAAFAPLRRRQLVPAHASPSQFLRRNTSLASKMRPSRSQTKTPIMLASTRRRILPSLSRATLA